MWLVAEKGAQTSIRTNTMRLFDNQTDAENYANSLEDTVVCYYFEAPNKKYSNKFIYYPTGFSVGCKNKARFNNANFTIRV